MGKKLALAVLACCSIGLAQAATTTYGFTGHLGTSNISEYLPAGQGFSGYISIDSTIPDANAAVDVGLYQTPPTISLTLAGGYTVSTIGSSGVGNMLVWDYPAGGGMDYFRAESSATGASLSFVLPNVTEVYAPRSFLMALGNSDGTAFSSDALPISALSLAQFDNVPNSFIEIKFEMTSPYGYTYPYLFGIFDSITLQNSVPEPGGLALLGLALAGLAAFRGRKKLPA